MRRGSAWLLIGGLVLSCGAQAQSLRFSTDASAPVHLQAKEMRWQKNKQLADLSGGAQVVQGPMQLDANIMQVRFDRQGGAQNLLASGALVVRGQDGQRATAERGDFDLQQDILVLTGNVTFTLANNQNANAEAQKLSGTRLQIDMKTGTAKLTGGKSRARIEIPAQ